MLLNLSLAKAAASSDKFSTNALSSLDFTSLKIAFTYFLATTSSGQGDKSKTEISIDVLIKSHYPNAKFVGFVDGIGWYVRKGDLKRMVTAYEDVFTFHTDELRRFEKLLIETFKNDK